MSEKKFFYSFVFLTTLFVVLGAAINFFVDPAGAFFKGQRMEQEVGEYTKKMLNSSVGVRLRGQPRSIKYHLFSHHRKFDCLILGSSHVIQLSTLTPKSSLKDICSSSLNLGVGGGNLEDLLVFLSFLEESDYHGKILVGIDPWTMKLGLSQGYNSYPLTSEEEKKLMGKFPGVFQFQKSSFDYKGLLSFDYLKTSFKYILKHGVHSLALPPVEMFVPPNWSILDGYEDGALLSDGAHVYGIFHTKVHRTDANYHALGSYSLQGSVWEERAWEIFGDVIEKLKHKNELKILLMPYHPNVFKESNFKYLAYIQKMEERVRKEMKRHEVKVLGTYDSRRISCDATEFYDAEHANILCLNRVNFKVGLDDF